MISFKPFFLIAGAVLLLANPPPAVAADGPYKVGIADLVLTDPVEGRTMLALAAYPTKDIGEPTFIGLFTVEGARRTTPEPGPFPLVIFSHMSMGSRLDHHDSMAELARAGFVAVAVEHPRDNWRDYSGVGTDRQTVGRSHHIVALIDGILTDPTISASVDRTRIGMVGFDAGGYTALVTVGGRPNFTLSNAYAKVAADDPMMAHIKAASQRRRPGFEPVPDPRVRAAFIMAPTYSFVFDRDALKSVQAPVRLYQAEKDKAVREPWNVENIRKSLPKPPESEVIAGAEHFVFFSPCSPDLDAVVSLICRDPDGVNREKVHEKLNAEMIEFFRRTLPAK